MWFNQLKQALPNFYTKQHPLNIVGYLRGAGSPAQWRMSAQSNRDQAIILGNEPPTAKDWMDAGVPHRGGSQQIIKIEDINGWIVIQNGGSPRPWGKLYEIDDDCLKLGFPASLRNWRTNYN